MRQFSQVVLERRSRHAESFATEPFEVAWASEAIFFLTVEELEATCVAARVEISPDGVNWLDEGTRFPDIENPGLHFVRVRHFGGWLRLACELTGTGGSRVLVHLILKE